MNPYKNIDLMEKKIINLLKNMELVMATNKIKKEDSEYILNQLITYSNDLKFMKDIIEKSGDVTKVNEFDFKDSIMEINNFIDNINKYI